MAMDTHAQSFHLARRLSSRNEPDLLQESFTSVSSDSDPSNNYSMEFCKALVDKMCVDSTLPSECTKFPGIVSDVKRRNSNKSNHAIAFAGMSPGEQTAAMKAREQGRLNDAQIKRRLTSSGRRFQK